MSIYKTETKVSAKTWKECKLGDVVIFGNGKSRPKIEGEYPIYGGNGILGYANEFNYTNETIILGRVGAYCGSVYYENKPIWVSDNALSAKPKEGNHLKFLYYFLKNMDLNSHAGGSSHPLITQSLLNSLDVEICIDFKEQKAIAEILSSLDDKIDLLHRQNQTLENLAQTLFRQWFGSETLVSPLDEAKASFPNRENWEIGTLGDILSTIESGSRPKGGIDPELKNGFASIGAESINGIGNFNFKNTKYITEDFFQSLKRGIVNTYDVLIYKDGAYIGKKAMFGNGFPFKEFAINEHVFILRTNEKANQFFLYFLLEQDELAMLNTNSAQPGLNQEAMKSFEIIIPPFEIIEEFGALVKDKVDKILFNSKQIQTLENLRDTLLPKLLSGEIKVKI